jgi:NADPH:quinone reductase
MRVVWFGRFGGPEVMEVAEVPDPVPEEGEVLVDLRAASVNRADILLRSGSYHAAPPFPIVTGREGAGVVREVGPGVEGLAPGRRVVAFGGRPGFYAQAVAAPASKVLPLPEGVGWEEAAALPTAWVTAWYCLRRLARVREGETVLVFAAASGVGDAAVQIAKDTGARVIGTAGSPEKVAWAVENGADVGVDHEREDVVAAVTEATEGRGADVVIDAVGGRAFTTALKAVGHLGRVVALANVTLEDSVVNTRDFYPKNATIHGFQISNLMDRTYDPRPDLAELLGLVAEGRFHVHVDRVFPLEEAAGAHRYLEERRNRGKVLLDPRRSA